MKKIFLLYLGLFIAFSAHAEEVELLNETFATSFGSFTLDEQPYPGCTYESVWYINTDYGYAYINVNNGTSSRGASDCKLVSPEIDCAEKDSVILTFNHTTYDASENDSNYLFLQVTMDGNTWDTLKIPAWPTTRWDWTQCEVDLTAYKSSKMQFRFRYISTTTYAPAWRVKDVAVKGVKREEEKEYVCYYPQLEGLCGDAMLESLHNLIAAHTVMSYDAIRADKAKVDIVADSVADMYSGCKFLVSDYCGIDEEEVECNCYNREHMLPKSWWGGSTTVPMYTDLHHIIPTDFVANTTRSAYVYDEVLSPTWSNSLGSKLGTSTNFYGEKAFEPADEYKGDVARTYFYMMTCYKDSSFTRGGRGSKFFQSGTAKLNNTALNLLLKWHRNDSVSTKEKMRNEKVAQKQGNRNPFVDSPELVEYIWGTMKNIAYKCNGTIIKPDTSTTGGLITCQQAHDYALRLTNGTSSDLEYSVKGYVTYVTDKYSTDYKTQSFKMADEKGGNAVFLAYRCYGDSVMNVGDKVLVSGYLYNYSGTAEIKSGKYKLVERAKEELAIEEINMDNLTQCRVFNIMGVEVSNDFDALPRGLYVIYHKGQSKTIIK